MHGFRIAEGRGADEGALRFAGLSLDHAAWLPVTRIEDGAGELFGVILGWPISGETWTRVEGTLRVERGAGDLAAFHRQHLEPLRGSWLAVLAGSGAARVYLDPFATMGLVFDPAARLAGGTAADIVTRDAYFERLDAPLRSALGVAGDGWFPGGSTAHRGVERLLAGHYLDLESFAAVRHNDWREVRPASGVVDEHLAVIAEEVRGVASAIRRSGRRLAMGLTGGADSRMILAALRGMTEDVLFYTVDAPGGRFDRDRASEIARRYGLRHEVLPYRRASPAQSDKWDSRVGHVVATANRTMYPSVEPLRDYVCLGGLGGEVGRCFLWRDITEVPAQIDAHFIVDRLKLPRIAVVEERIERWLDELDETDPCRVLDIAYIEQRMGPWAFAQSYANPLSLVLHPLGSAAALRAMLALPAAYRQGDGMIRGVIERCWPELLELPINRYGDSRDIVRRLARLAQPARAVRKLRQIYRSRA